jgi:membrane-bound serine protease (ClpP class)
MSLIIGLLIGAIVLIFLEVLLPGGILGVLAVCCLVGASVQAGMLFSLVAGVLVFLGGILFGLIMIFVQFKLFEKTALGKRFFLRSSIQGGSRPTPSTENLSGKSGVALTRLNPTGKVEIEGQSYEAYSRDGYLEAGDPIQVISQDSLKITIQKL